MLHAAGQIESSEHLKEKVNIKLVRRDWLSTDFNKHGQIDCDDINVLPNLQCQIMDIALHCWIPKLT
jgi:hypothetical protein